MANIGDWVTPKWNGHEYYGQTGEIVGFDSAGGARIDFNGDGAFDSTIHQSHNVLDSSGYTLHRVESVTEDIALGSIAIFDICISVVIATVYVLILSYFIKKIKKR